VNTGLRDRPKPRRQKLGEKRGVVSVLEESRSGYYHWLSWRKEKHREKGTTSAYKTRKGTENRRRGKKKKSLFSPSPSFFRKRGVSRVGNRKKKENHSADKWRESVKVGQSLWNRHLVLLSYSLRKN